jgi:hypothetical protein
MGASHIKRIFGKLHSKVVNYGTTKNINRSRHDMEQKLIQEKSCIVIMPENTFKKIWNILMIFLLFYVASYVPYSVCFDNRAPDAPAITMDYVDATVDFLFFVDIIVNFISAYEDPITNLPVIKMRKIASNYLTGWFWLDLIAVIPV